MKFPIERYDDLLEEIGFESLRISPTHAIAAGRLPRHHGDPFDRMLIAQANIEGLALVSADPVIARYDVALLSARG